MGINFPNAPTTNQLYPQPPVAGLPVYRWDGEKWTGQSATVSGPGAMLLAATGQDLSGGVYSTPYQYATGSITVDFSLNPIQWINNNGAFTITAPTHDGSCILTIFNQAGAGAVTFTGWTVGSNTGDAIDTVNGHKFSIMMWRVNGVASYSVKALQ